MRARLAARRGIYRGFPGWLVCGVDGHGRRVDVFVRTRDEAERVKVNIGAGRHVFDGLAVTR